MGIWAGWDSEYSWNQHQGVYEVDDWKDVELEVCHEVIHRMGGDAQYRASINPYIKLHNFARYVQDRNEAIIKENYDLRYSDQI